MRSGCVLLMVMLTACQHIQWTRSPLPVTLTPNLNLNTTKNPSHPKNQREPIHPYYGRPLCDDVLLSKDPTVKNHQRPAPCIPKQARRYERPFFLLEDWF